jgi:hypothetical protein
LAIITISGNTSGSISLSAPDISGSNTLTLPVATDTLIGKATTDTLTNKSIAATQLTGTIAAARLPAGSVLQVVNAQSGAVATGTTIIPFDNTIPQITEGTEFLSLAITPKFSTSKLLIQVIWNGASTNPANIIALFQDATANALAVSATSVPATGLVAIPLNYFMTAGTTSSTTFRLRYGCNNAATVTTNGAAGAAAFGGVYATSITITEIAA